MLHHSERKSPAGWRTGTAGQACKEEPESMHTKTLVDQFTESLRARNLAASTVKPYRAELLQLASFIEEHGILLGEVTIHHLTSYIARNENANTTRNRQLVVLRQFFTWLDHPAAPSLLAMRAPRVTRPAPDFLTPNEERALRLALNRRTDQQHQVRDRALIFLMLDTGLRVAEASRLLAGSVQDKHVRVLAKGGKIRAKFLPTATRQALAAHAGHLQPHDPLFQGAPGQALSDRHVRRIVAGWAQLAGIQKRVHPHTLRHTFATSLLQQNGNLRLVQRAMDHASPQTTAVYTHVVDAELEAAMECRV
jgi:site-specific recombinase XerD